MFNFLKRLKELEAQLKALSDRVKALEVQQNVGGGPPVPPK